MEDPAAVAAKKTQEQAVKIGIGLSVLVALGIFAYQFTREAGMAYSQQKRQPWDAY